MGALRDVKQRRFQKWFVAHLLSALGAIAALLGLLDLFFIDVFQKANPWWFLLVVCIAITYALWRSWPRPIQQEYSTPNTKISVVTGDLFKQDTSLVIGVADSFDVETPHIIQTNSVQGQLLHQVYKGDLGALKTAVAAALADHTPTHKVPALHGNTDRYECGTVASIRDQRTYYYCVAYTKMDEHNNVTSTIGILWDALEELWQEVRKRSNGDAVSVPVIGMGQSGLSTVLPIQDAIRFLILTFMFASRKQHVCRELRIVVHPSDEPKVDMLELQAFLTSLKRS